MTEPTGYYRSPEPDPANRPPYPQHWPPHAPYAGFDSGQLQPRPPAAAPRNGAGVTAMVVGIVGLVMSFIPFVGVLAWPLVILGIAFGAVGIRAGNRGEASNRGQAIAGLVTSLLGLVVCVVWLLAILAAAGKPVPRGSTAEYTGLSPAQWSQVASCTERGALSPDACRKLYGP